MSTETDPWPDWPKMPLNEALTLLVKRGKKVHEYPPGKWYIDRNTEVGEPADIYVRMPDQGRKWINRSDIVGQK